MTDENLTFASPDDFTAWMEQHHSTAAEVWVALPKKGTPVPSVSRAEALDVALCYGWIDGKSFSGNVPDGWWAQRFTPRRKRSSWSKINCARVEQLIAEGRMRPAGLAQIEAAKADGRWDRAYSPPSTATVPADLRAALDAEPAAAAAFDKLSRSNRYQILFAVERAVRPETRARRIATHVARLAAGEPPSGP
ncbi:uncharacterized protein YdeI (YjbR/CyaY-like superfamily) [Krasilnikovia cinnamomea]|uniref:Uncharacterized protein YdeI (YjbR/CyaY-like superfamily) n=1 Tax=Krasilnikovia cinnamomea TaxID=349313 RepID=A0A4Q7ZN09_9ACTN|nr:YdeI/OmpD-associated family protein [Krasilnikovia cinnamomea]RZU52407.1 uncharacterized protein YdeI (YjbR/CyaY-like superfamily) [Krasilnikovia cinnamomea]